MVQREPDPYRTLGVSRDDGPTAIRGAFHDLVRRVRAATAQPPPFLAEVTDAYDVLGGRPAPPRAAAPPAAGVLLDLLADFDGGRPSREEVRALLRANFTSEGLPKSGRLEVLELTLRLDGPVELALAVPVFHPCPACHGTGGIALVRCGACDGHGVAEARAVVALELAPGQPQTVIDLSALGVRTPGLRLRAA